MHNKYEVEKPLRDEGTEEHHLLFWLISSSLAPSMQHSSFSFPIREFCHVSRPSSSLTARDDGKSTSWSRPRRKWRTGSSEDSFQIRGFVVMTPRVSADATFRSDLILIIMSVLSQTQDVIPLGSILIPPLARPEIILNLKNVKSTHHRNNTFQINGIHGYYIKL